MTRFVTVTAEDMDVFLVKRGFTPMALAGVREAVYGRVMGNGYILAVFTGIEDGVSRRKGKDAMRVALIHSGKVLTTMPHVKRLATWRENLTDRFRNWKTMAGEKPCPLCGGLTLMRRSKRGQFYGCARFPECRGTVSETK